MRKILGTLAVIVMATLMITGCNKQEKVGLEGIKERGKMVVGLDDSFPPMGFRDENNEIVGFDIDLARELAKHLGVEVEFRPVVWETITMSLNKGDIDMVWNGCTITPARQKEMEFSTPYLKNEQIIVVGPNSDIKGKADLAGKTIAIQLGSSSQEALEKDQAVFNSLKDVSKFENNVDALLDLTVGRVDAVVVDSIVGHYYKSLNPDDYVVLDESFDDELYGIGMRKEDTTFIEAVNKGLTEMANDGTAEAISVKWFGENIFIN